MTSASLFEPSHSSNVLTSLDETFLAFNGALIPYHDHVDQVPRPLLDQQRFHYALTGSDDDGANLASFQLASSSSKLPWNTNQH